MKSFKSFQSQLLIAFFMFGFSTTVSLASDTAPSACLKAAAQDVCGLVQDVKLRLVEAGASREAETVRMEVLSRYCRSSALIANTDYFGEMMSAFDQQFFRLVDVLPRDEDKAAVVTASNILAAYTANFDATAASRQISACHR